MNNIYTYIMNLIGYFHIREVDSIRYNIYKISDTIYVNYKNKMNIINLPKKFMNMNNINIVLSKVHGYDNYYKEKQDNFQFIYINNEKIKNDNIINFII